MHSEKPPSAPQVVESSRAAEVLTASERDREYEFFARAIEAAYSNANAQLQLRSQEIITSLKEDFYKQIQRLTWGLGVLGLLATLGGFISIKEIVKTAVNDQIAAQQREIDKLKTSALEDVVALRTEARVAASDSKRTAEESQKEVRDALAVAKANVTAQSEEMDKQIIAARKAIDDTLGWWENARLVREVASKDAAGKSNTGGQATTPSSQQSTGKSDDDAERTRAIYRMLKCVQGAGVVDADVDMFIAVIDSDEEALKKAMDNGASAVARDLTVLRKHKAILEKNCPGLVPNNF